MFDYLKTIIKHRFLRHKGFTLLETLFAILIIVIAFMAIFGLVNFGISSISVSKNKLIAAELGQEGIELVRWRREIGGTAGGSTWTASDWTNWFNDEAQIKGYFRFLISPANPNNNPTYEKCGGPCAAWPINTYDPNIITSINDLNSYFQLRYDQTKRVYNHTGGDFTNFFRIIHISSPQPADNGVNHKRVITSQVFWIDRGRLSSVRMVDYLYNWRQP